MSSLPPEADRLLGDESLISESTFSVTNPSLSTRTVLEMLSMGEELREKGKFLFSLGAGSPAVSEALKPYIDFLKEAWGDVANRQIHEVYAYPHPQGSSKLRELLARRTNKSVGADRYSPEHILITNGGQEGLFVLAATFPQPVILVPHQTYLGAVGAFTRAGKLLVGVNYDEEGMIPNNLSQKIALVRSYKLDPAFVYVNPSFTNPTGEIMPLARRTALYEVAEESEIHIVEDDPYKDSVFPGNDYLVPPPIAALENNEITDRRVIELDSLSKVLAPGLRTGWIACDDEKLFQQLLYNLVATRSDVGLGNNLPVQRFLEYLLPQENVISQIKENYRSIHARKKKLTAHLFDEHNLRQHLDLNDPTGGLFFWGKLLDQRLSASQIRERLHEKDGEVVTSQACSPPQNIFNGPPSDNAFRINFSGLPNQYMSTAVEKFAEAIREELEYIR